MKKISLVLRKSTAILLATLITCGMIPTDLLSKIDISDVFSPLKAEAEEIKLEESSQSAGANFTAPEVSFKDELYDGSDAISPLPSYEEYKEQTGYTEPLRISLTDLRAECGEGLNFNVGLANAYMSDGYKLMICNADELYNYSMIVNGAGSTDEVNFYLSANIVLGDNIEYAEYNDNQHNFKPIGNVDNPFVGTFDGQCFEIRDLYFDKEYGNVTVAFFGVVGEGAEVKNFGLYHPTIISTANNSTYTASIAAINNGTIDSVYAIAQEYRDPSDQNVAINVIKSSLAESASGLVASNTGTLSNSYFAGMLDSSEPEKQHPVCAINSGKIINCYYDQQVFPCGLLGSMITELEGDVEITGLDNIDLKKVFYSENGMKNTNFKPNLAKYDIEYIKTDVTHWNYPRLYGFIGSGTKDDPYIISKPADLVYFPSSAEYLFTNPRKYFQLEKCIDMNEVAPNAYEPQLDFTFYTNKISGNTWVQQVNKYENRAFYGNLSGASHSGDEDCPIHHVTNMGVDSESNALQECHAILNLTINQPATNGDKRYTALIPFSSSGWHSTYFPTISDIHFIGGEISSGDMDCMPSTYSAESYNVKTATVVSLSDGGTNLKNVHSSATVKIGTGNQYSVNMGGLMASGIFHFVTDCTNSGDIVGGYVNMPGETYQKENYQLGGLLGAAGSGADLQERFLGKLTHVANYGNVYGVVVVAPKGSGWNLTAGTSGVAGIARNSIASIGTGETAFSPSGQSSYYYDDSSRVDRVANFGMIFDGPISLDENDEPIFDENGKPQSLPLADDKELICNVSPKFYTVMYGIANEVVSNSYNEGNIYSVFTENCQIAGIGYLSTSYNATLNQYYNFLNYNVGDIYMYAGAREANGIAKKYAYKCYNSGSIYLLGGSITTASSYSSVSNEGGAFSGISSNNSKGCYFDGEIYIAPSARKFHNYVNNQKISIAGVSQYYSSYITEIDDKGNEVIIPTVNKGKITLDLDTYKFDPALNTPDINNVNQYPYFYMMGTGIGSYCYNLGTFDFIENSNDNSQKINLDIAGLGGLFMSYRTTSIINSANYADISVNTSKDGGSLYSLNIMGLGYYSSPSDSKDGMSQCANLGDISFSGALGRNLSIYTLGYNSPSEQSKISNNVNLGDVTVDASTIKGIVGIYDLFISTTNTKQPIRGDSFMHGWYDGCNIPDGVNEVFSDVFEKLDKSRRYGQIEFSGTIIGDGANAGNALVITSLGASVTQGDCIDYCKNIVGNGTIIVRNVEVPKMSINAVALLTISDSENNMPITVENVISNGYSYVSSGLGGENNVNNAPITVSHCLIPNGLPLNVLGISALPVSNCENRGDITVKDCSTATVNNVEYKSKRIEDGTIEVRGEFFVAGIAKEDVVENSINFGTISVSDVPCAHVGGIASFARNNIRDCYNYGDIICDDIAGFTCTGGISGSSNGSSVVSNCYNFATITVKNPNSYFTPHHPNLYFGGIVGINRATQGLTSNCVNYGDIIYDNTKGENPDSTSFENTRQANSLNIGGVVGCNEKNVSLCNSANYADINVLNEENLNVYVGGITGLDWINNDKDNTALCSSFINYGNLSVPDANTNMNQTVQCGGILGGTATYGSKIYEYGINYGTVQSETEKAENTYIGSLLGGGHNHGYSFNKFVDLSDLPSGATYYPLVGYVGNNSAESSNYTKNPTAVNDTGATFGTVKLVTLDKQQNSGVFSADFIFRSDLQHDISEWDSNDGNINNGLMYQEYDQLSPYLQEYMVKKFENIVDIKNYGAYVVTKGIRFSDDFIPGEKINLDNLTEEGLEAAKKSLPGRYIKYDDGTEYVTFLDETLLNDEIDPIYSSLLDPSERSMLNDYNIYQQQVDKSSMAEVHDFEVDTKYLYYNKDTLEYQYFEDHDSLEEMNPAYDSDGNVSDNVIYTDINVYFAVDDIDTTRPAVVMKVDENGDIVRDENGDVVYQDVEGTTGKIILTHEYLTELNFSAKSTFQTYTGGRLDISPRLEKVNHYSDNYSKPWITVDNLSEMLAVTKDWDDSNWNGINNWVMEIPYQSNDDMQNVYNQVLGVVTAEDGIHKNIVVVHVFLDKFKPYATVDSVSFGTPKDDVQVSTVENNLLIETNNMPSVTDFVDDVPITDVSYYKFSDEGLTGENIKRYNWENTANEDFNNNSPHIYLTTYNMDVDGKIYYDVYHQNRIPVEGEKYNDLIWNEKADSEHVTSGTLYPEDIVTDKDQRSTGKVEFMLDNETVFYGGLYKVELFYERTKNSDKRKHFATIFIAKENSPNNTIQWGFAQGLDKLSPSNSDDTLSLQNTYDETHLLVEGKQQGYLAFFQKMYDSGGFNFAYIDREWNDSKAYSGWNYNWGIGKYYGLRGYISDYPSITYYIDQGNPMYNLTDESDTDYEITRGKEVILEQNFTSVNVYRDEGTGAFYPTMFKGIFDIMAENGDIRRYTYESVKTGTYGENDEYSVDNKPKVNISFVNKNNIPVTADENGIRKGIIYGDEKTDTTISAQWYSSNVTLDDTCEFRIYFTPLNSEYTVELTQDEISQYFYNISKDAFKTYFFTLRNTAPVGTYKIVPYVNHTSDLSKNPYNIELRDSVTGELISECVTSEDKKIKWTIPYSEPLIIENLPNNETYLTEYNTSNDQYTPFILENSNVSGADDRYAYINQLSDNQEIVYIGYEDVMVGDTRVDKFDIYSYVLKTVQESDIRFKAPYLATVSQWEGDTSPLETVNGTWNKLTPTSDENGIREYNLHVEYNEKIGEGEYSYKPSVTYYKVTAEDGKTSTIYTVHVVPAVRNKLTTMEIAQTSEIAEINGSDPYKESVARIFAESDEVYKEIISNGGLISATIKELDGNVVDLYQTKFYNEDYAVNGVSPYIYNLKSFIFDISVDVPDGYDYDILVFSSGMDNYTKLKDSRNGFDGKQLILSNSDTQELNIRIVLKRTATKNVWGVQHIWNNVNALRDTDGKPLNNGGGRFYNYVYKRDE